MYTYNPFAIREEKRREKKKNPINIKHPVFFKGTKMLSMDD